MSANIVVGKIEQLTTTPSRVWVLVYQYPENSGYHIYAVYASKNLASKAKRELAKRFKCNKKFLSILSFSVEEG